MPSQKDAALERLSQEDFEHYAVEAVCLHEHMKSVETRIKKFQQYASTHVADDIESAYECERLLYEKAWTLQEMRDLAETMAARGMPNKVWVALRREGEKEMKVRVRREDSGCYLDVGPRN